MATTAKWSSTVRIWRVLLPVLFVLGGMQVARGWDLLQRQAEVDLGLVFLVCGLMLIASCVVPERRLWRLAEPVPGSAADPKSAPRLDFGKQLLRAIPFALAALWVGKGLGSIFFEGKDASYWGDDFVYGAVLVAFAFWFDWLLRRRSGTARRP